MSGAVFVDTSAWYAAADVGDTSHGPAARRLRRLIEQRRTLVTTNHVVGETYTLLRVRLGATAAGDFSRRVRASPLTRRTFVPQSWEGGRPKTCWHSTRIRTSATSTRRPSWRCTA